MMIRFSQITITCLLLVFTAACTRPGQNSVGDSTAPAGTTPAQRITSESVVKVATQAIEVPAGGAAEITVSLTIQNGYHVNANPPTYPYLKATVLEIPAADGVSAGPVTYPQALVKKFAFAEENLAVYEGQTEIKAQLKAEKTVKPGQRSISATLRIQACDDQVCYAPGAVEFAIPANIK